MSSKTNNVEVLCMHDRKGIEIRLDDDSAELTLPQAEELARALNTIIAVAHSTTPPAPAPLLLQGHNWPNGKDESFAQCGMMEPGMHRSTWYGGMGGYELNYTNLIQIRDWCNKALKYVDDAAKEKK